MAINKAFVDASGNEYSPAHFRCVQINISAADKAINLVFYAYKDAEAFASGKQPLPGGVKSYAIGGNDFLSIASAAPVGATLYDVLAHASENYAMSKKDVDTGQKDDQGKPVMASFFEGGTQV